MPCATGAALHTIQIPIQDIIHKLRKETFTTHFVPLFTDLPHSNSRPPRGQLSTRANKPLISTPTATTLSRALIATLRVRRYLPYITHVSKNHLLKPPSNVSFANSRPFTAPYSTWRLERAVRTRHLKRSRPAEPPELVNLSPAPDLMLG